MKNIFIVFATVFALCANVHANPYRPNPSNVMDQPCAGQSLTWAEKDFSFYSNGTVADGSPAISCNDMRLLQHIKNPRGDFFVYSTHCHTLDHAIGKVYEVTALQSASGECTLESLRIRSQN